MIEDLVRQAAEDDDAEELGEIADSDPARLAPHHGLMLDLGVVWPAKLYRAAGAATIERVVAEVDAGQERLRLNHLLLILAHSGHPLAEQAIRRWSTQPPPGADELYYQPLAYTREGGWTIDPDGTRRELCAETAFELHLEEGVPSAKTCPWCATPLWVAADLTAETLPHTGWQGRLVIETCYLCACYETLFSQVTPDGGTTWWPGNTPPDYLPKNLGPEDPRTLRAVVGRARESPFSVSAWNSGGSTLGGHPDWIQDADHPDCPGCGQAMHYLGLIGGADIDDGEGAYYLHLHAPCGFAAVNYQQS
ncbi:hypothetical protein ACTI_83920 [Actinoplanes sp. OR16]|uniref:hypothetical protein n=1 Tax=Actinoplanes sp. OR16 TaxID=946334 RepID=UPI000F6F31BC|nr:hypothetical protein [Actinoplanes sp. OR16]BBH71707.1 hypothetical protein ACTI_83920 [Actinoplanes sp. OR16]